MPLSTGTVVFPLQHTQGLCAAYSQLWLSLGLRQGSPVLSSAAIPMPRLMSASRSIAGKSVVAGLISSGLAMVGAPVVLRNVAWPAAFWRIAQCPGGWYYLTIGVTVPPPDNMFRHATACFVEDGGGIYFLDGEIGLTRFATAGALVGGAAPWYAGRMRRGRCDELGAYRVEAALRAGAGAA